MACALPLLCFAIASAGAQSSEVGIVEPGGARVAIESGNPVRYRGQVRETLDCTAAEGTGELFDLAADPAGLTFFAAEKGLFVLGPLVNDLDPVWLREGSPAGVPSSVYVDERRRVWLATDQAVGVVEPSFGWGRTLDENDGLKIAPPYRLEASEGGIRVKGANGAWTYRVDQGERPTVTTLQVNGTDVAADAMIDAGFGDDLRIEAAGMALGGARFRMRVDGHHVWRPLEEGGTLGSLNPGEHLVEIVAVDRDLNLSEPLPLRVRVAMPFYYGKAFVLGAMALVGAVVFALAILLQRPGTPPMRRALAGIMTTAVALIFGVQVLAGLVPHAKGWPFVGYSMYSKSFRPERPVHRPVLVARHKDGAEREIPPWALGYAIDGRWQILGPIVTGGPSVERDAMERVRKRVTGPDYTVLQVQSRRFRLTENGPVPIAPLVLSHYEHGSLSAGPGPGGQR